MAIDLDQARRQAKELLRAARDGDAGAVARIAAVRSDRPAPQLADAQTAVARGLGFPSWPALVLAVVRRAVRDGDVERVRALLAGGASVRGSDLLLDARVPAITQLLIEAGARLDARDADGLTPYARAARFRSDANARLLAAAGGATELDPAAEWVGAVVRAELARAAEIAREHPDLMLRWDDCEQLPRWASAGEDAVVARLLDHGLPVDARGVGEGTAAHYAALWGRASTLRLLLSRGADVGALAQAPDEDTTAAGAAAAWTLLDWAGWGAARATGAAARRDGYRSCARALIAAGGLISGRADAGVILDGRHETQREYVPGAPVRVTVRVRGARVDVDDMGGAVLVAGRPEGWRAVADGVAAAHDWNIRSTGTVFMQCPGAGSDNATFILAYDDRLFPELLSSCI